VITVSDPTRRINKTPRGERRKEKTSPLVTESLPLEEAMKEVAHINNGVSRKKLRRAKIELYISRVQKFLRRSLMTFLVMLNSNFIQIEIHYSSKKALNYLRRGNTLICTVFIFFCNTLFIIV